MLRRRRGVAFQSCDLPCIVMNAYDDTHAPCGQMRALTTQRLWREKPRDCILTALSRNA